MKRYHIHTFLVTALLVAACSSQSRPREVTTEAKKTRLESLKRQLFQLQAEITALEQEIAAEDSSFRLSQALPVTVVVLKDKGFQTSLRLQGAVDNRQALLLSAKSPGTLLKLYVEEGASVQAGQLLAEQDAEVLRKNITEVRTRLELARTLYEKQKRLYDEGIGSEVQLLTAKNNKESLEATLAALEAQLQNSQIRAPQAGRVDAILVKAGELLMPGMPVIRLLSGTGTWEVKAEVPERFSGTFRAGMPLTVELPDIGESFQAPIAVVGENINPISRTFTVQVRALPGRLASRLRPGMTAFVALPEATYPEAFRVPVEAVQFQDTTAYVHLYRQGVAQRRIVRFLGAQAGQAAIEGLQTGDSVIVLGAALLTQGQAVTLSSESF